jgi:hypothetical protein
LAALVPGRGFQDAKHEVYRFDGALSRCRHTVDTVSGDLPVLRHRQRAHAAFVADTEELKAPGESITTYAFGALGILGTGHAA